LILSEDDHESPDDPVWDGIDGIDEDPTLENIKDRMRWLTKNASEGDELFFYCTSLSIFAL